MNNKNNCAKNNCEIVSSGYRYATPPFQKNYNYKTKQNKNTKQNNRVCRIMGRADTSDTETCMIQCRYVFV